MENKQTAVEWVFDKIIRCYEEEEWIRLIEQAKEMEKEQIENSFNESRLTHPLVGFKHDTFNCYYEKTYGTPR